MKKWYAVIGDPIAHSRSPEMHTRWLDEEKIDASYIPIHLTKEQLAEGVNSLRLLGCSGWNVTVPHKEAIIPLLDAIDPLAEKMQAVNTVVRQADGTLKGYNTDGLGYVRSLEERFPEISKESRVLIIGAGGAAKGIAFAMKQEGYSSITITNRTMERAETLAQSLGKQAMTLDEASEQLDSFDILIQTTSVGMQHSIQGVPLDLANLRSDAIVTDIIYTPKETEFLRLARQKGAKTMNGLGMFIHQGALAFSYWTNRYPDAQSLMNEWNN